MATVGEQLRAGREARNLTVEQVADITKMRSDHVRAIEQGDFKVFSAPVYIKGFVRTYARLVKLDETSLSSAIERELDQTGRFEDDPSRSGQKGGVVDFATLQLSKLDWRKSLIALAVAVLIGGTFLAVAAWRKASTNDPLKDLPPGIYKPTNDIVETLPPGKN
jgi:cytoskeletal protein RodZ